MRFFFIIIVFLFFVSGNTQSPASELFSEKNIQDSSRDTSIDSFETDLDNDSAIICDIPPEPEVDRKKWVAYLTKSLELDSASLDTIPAGTYTVMAQFTIDEKGNLQDVSILKDPGYGLSQRVVKVISNCPGLWKPSMYNGHTTISYRKQPILFIVEKDEDECDKKIPPGPIL
jgi:hypothetical protein